jgi:hypothetical protein
MAKKFIEVKLPRKFSEHLIHGGVPELGRIEHSDRYYIWWHLTKDEAIAMLSDAKNVLAKKRLQRTGRTISLYPASLRKSAQLAFDILTGVLGETDD